MSDEWYVYPAAVKGGPFTTAEVKQLASAGDLDPNDFLLEEGAGSAVAARTVTGLPLAAGGTGRATAKPGAMPSAAHGGSASPFRDVRVIAAASVAACVVIASVVIIASRGRTPEPAVAASGGTRFAPGGVTMAAQTDPINRTAPSHITVLDKWARHLKGVGGTPFAFSPDGTALIAGVREGGDFVSPWRVVRLDLETERVLSDRLPFGEVMLFYRDAFGNNTIDANQLKALDLPEARQAVVREHVLSISRTRKKGVLLGYSPGAEYVALRGNPRTAQDASVEVWHVGSKQQVVRQSPPAVGDEEGVTLAFSPDQRFVAQAAGYEVRVWELPSGRLVATIHSAANRYLVFSPDGKWLLTQHFEDGRVNKPSTPDPGKLVLWKVDDWKTHHALHPGGSEHNLGNQCAFTPDGKLLATTDDDAGAIRRVTIWDVERGTLRGGFQALEFADLAFSPDGTLLATWGGSLPHAVNFWDVTGGQLKYRIESQLPVLTSFSPNGRIVAVRAGNGASLLYDLSSGTKVPFMDEVKQERDRLAKRPDISKPAPPITKASYDQVRIGMTRFQVLRILGGTGETVRSDVIKRNEGSFGYSVIYRDTVRYVGAGGGYAHFEYEGTSTDTPLVGKHEFGLR